MNAWLVGLTLIGLGVNAPAATWTVNDTSDAGDGTCDATCTLRDAINAAGTDDRVLFDLALPSPVLITLTGPPLNIDVPMRITTNDGVPTTVRRDGTAGRLLDVAAGGDARIVGLNFQGGRAGSTAGELARGGAILVAAGAALELRQCVFRDNRALGFMAPALSPGAAAGGAIYSLGDLIVDGSSFVLNIAQGGDASAAIAPIDGDSGAPAQGGAIHAAGGLTVLNSTFSQNRAQGGRGGDGGMTAPPGFPGWKGGDGGSASGGALSFDLNAVATVAFSTLIGNQVVGGPGGTGGPGMPPGDAGTSGLATGAALAANDPTILNTSVVAQNLGQACSGVAITARTSNRVDDASCPGQLIATLATEFEPIDTNADSPRYTPLFGSSVIDTAADCLDAPAVEAVDLDQVLNPRPMPGGGPPNQCDHGAVEYSPFILVDGFEDPPPPP